MAYTKYQRLILQESNDGVNWVVQEPRQYKKGDAIEGDSTDCGGSGGVTEYRWTIVFGEYICINNDKYQKLKKQYLNVDTGEWIDVSPIETKEGELIEKNSSQCGYAEQWVDTDEWACKEVEERNYFNVYTYTDGNGTITISPSKTQYSSGDTISVYNTPNENHIFDYYQYESNNYYGMLTRESILTLNMINDWYVSAMFSSTYTPPPTEYYQLITLTDGNGAINVSPSKESYSSAENVLISVTPNANYSFNYYQYGSTTTYGQTTTNSTLTLTMSHNWYVSAAFLYSSSVIPTLGTLYYSYVNGTESYYEHSESILKSSYYSGRNATIISDLSGVVTSLPSYAFSVCYSLTTVSFPKCEYIGSCAFDYCRSLTTVSFPLCSYIGDEAFYSCSNLTTADFPKCRNIGSYAFYYCTNLTTANFPMCSYIGFSAFYVCRNLSTANFPLCSYIGSYAFAICSNLTTVSFPKCEYIGSCAFTYCSKLSTIYLMGSSVVSLAKSNAFSSTPIYSKSGSIYVPTSLVDAYKAHSVWSYFSDIIYGI